MKFQLNIYIILNIKKQISKTQREILNKFPIAIYKNSCYTAAIIQKGGVHT